MSGKALALAVSGLAALSAGCLSPTEDPSNVHDLRVLGVRLDPPEVFLAGCNPAIFAGLVAASQADAGVTLDPRLVRLLRTAAGQSIRYTALIADPRGAGRALTYRLRACANQGDRECAIADDSLELASGTASGGELSVDIAPGAAILPDESPLLFETIRQDTFRGLGGIRLPLVLEVAAPDSGERVWAQKLMVYQCPFFPSMRVNQQPLLPGLSFEGEPWESRAASGSGPFRVTPDDFSEREEPYVVPSVEFREVELRESWKVSWYTTVGQMAPLTTGGSDGVTGTGRHNVLWIPGDRSEPVEADFYVVVRDGRGGLSWLQRRVRWTP